MALNTLKCNRLMPLPFKGLSYYSLTIACHALTTGTDLKWSDVVRCGPMR